MVNKYNLLVVDDDRDILSTLELGLVGYYQVFTAACQKEALDVLGRVKIDLLLLDLRLNIKAIS